MALGRATLWLGSVSLLMASVQAQLPEPQSSQGPEPQTSQGPEPRIPEVKVLNNCIYCHVDLGDGLLNSSNGIQRFEVQSIGGTKTLITRTTNVDMCPQEGWASSRLIPTYHPETTGDVVAAQFYRDAHDEPAIALAVSKNRLYLMTSDRKTTVVSLRSSLGHLVALGYTLNNKVGDFQKSLIFQLLAITAASPQRILVIDPISYQVSVLDTVQIPERPNVVLESAQMIDMGHDTLILGIVKGTPIYAPQIYGITLKGKEPIGPITLTGDLGIADLPPKLESNVMNVIVWHPNMGHTFLVSGKGWERMYQLEVKALTPLLSAASAHWDRMPLAMKLQDPNRACAPDQLSRIRKPTAIRGPRPSAVQE